MSVSKKEFVPNLPRPHRPSFTDEHDPLYSLSRRSIFGTPKKSSFLEMAGVELGESEHTAVDQPRLESIGSIRSIFSNISNHHPISMQMPIPIPIPTSNPPSPEVSYHSHHSHNHTLLKKDSEILIPPQNLSINFSTVKLEEKEELSPNESSHSNSITLEQPPPNIKEEVQVQPTLQSKEKGVKGIVQQIENKPKKDGM